MIIHRLTNMLTTRKPACRRVVAVIVTMLLATSLGIGVTHATPGDSPVRYTLTTTATSVDLSINNGRIEKRADVVSIKDASGITVLSIPLRYRLEYREYPIIAEVSPHKVSLIPSRDVSKSRAVDPASVDAARKSAARSENSTTSRGPQTRQERDDAALARFNQQLAAGMTVSTLIGTAIGAVVGAIAGCILGLPLAGLGCLPGIPLGATLGGLAGTILGGGGVLIVAAIQYFQTINAPFTPPRE